MRTKQPKTPAGVVYLFKQKLAREINQTVAIKVQQTLAKMLGTYYPTTPQKGKKVPHA